MTSFAANFGSAKPLVELCHSSSWMSSLRTLPPIVVSKRMPAEIVRDPIRRRAAVERAAIDLLDRVAVVGIAQVEREVRKEVETVGAEERERRQLALVGRPQLVGRRTAGDAPCCPLRWDRSIQSDRRRPCSTARAGICPEPCQLPA